MENGDLWNVTAYGASPECVGSLVKQLNRDCKGYAIKPYTQRAEDEKPKRVNALIELKAAEPEQLVFDIQPKKQTKRGPHSRYCKKGRSVTAVVLATLKSFGGDVLPYSRIADTVEKFGYARKSARAVLSTLASAGVVTRDPGDHYTVTKIGRVVVA